TLWTRLIHHQWFCSEPSWIRVSILQISFSSCPSFLPPGFSFLPPGFSFSPPGFSFLPPGFSPDAPSNLVIYPRDEVELGEQNILVCHVSGFYPAPVNVSWTRNGQKVTEGTSINVPFPSKDSTFTQISRLQFVPQLGDIYSCSVEHLALTEPMTRTWDVEMDSPQSGPGPSIFCGVGLTIGLLGVAVGTFFLIKGNECS
ncbi:HLA class II histocompatibility antigen, DR alpha chain-like, partial [Poecilia formosa]|uniref:HLA class II histocompatibility antigen, DR alpha chain-like n=1 Tax=Poecilia formosa TaxID=48698 RepID=A0A096LQ78_POEFO